MNKIKLISDSSCDLTLEEQSKLDLDVIPFLVSFEGKEYIKDGIDISNDEFYKTLIDNPKFRPKTACPLMGDYLNAFEKYAKEGREVICICITSKFSGSYNSAMNAKEMVLENYKDAKVAVIDSEINTVAQGLMVSEVKRMIDSGLDFDTIIANIERIKKTGRIIFTIGNMDYLNRGGRIGRVAMVLASKVQIKPIIYLSDGDITAKGISIGRKKSLIKVIEKVKQYFNAGKEKVEDYVFTIGYGYDIEEAKTFATSIQKMFEEIGSKVALAIHQIGSTIAVHTGPHPLGIGFIKKYDI